MRLAARGIASARLDAELLLAHVLETNRAAVLAHPESPVGPDASAAFATAIGRREAGEPVAYIRGVREFHGVALAADSRALVPRPETELLVDAAVSEVAARLAAGRARPVRLADVGTGSGAIAVALLAALRRRGLAGDVSVTATDTARDALRLALENAVAHGVADRISFRQADLLPPGDGRFDVVCANLPYVATSDLDGLGPELAFEPRAALDGGSDGLAVIRRLLDRLPDGLAADGVALLEIGAGQAASLLVAVGRRLPGWDATVSADLAGRPRVARVRPPADRGSPAAPGGPHRRPETHADPQVAGPPLAGDRP